MPWRAGGPHGAGFKHGYRCVHHEVCDGVWTVIFFMLMYVYRGGYAISVERFLPVSMGNVYLSWAVLGRGCPDVTYHGVRCVHHKIQ